MFLEVSGYLQRGFRNITEGFQGAPRRFREVSKWLDVSLSFSGFPRQFQEVLRLVKAILGLSGACKAFEGSLKVVSEVFRMLPREFQGVL